MSEQQLSSSSRFNRKKENIFARLINAIKQSTTKQKVVVLVIIVGISLLVYGLNYLRVRQIAVNQNKCSSNEDLIASASAKIQTNSRKDMAPMIAKIEQFSDYDRDPNCLIPLTAYYIYKADESKATDYLAKLKATYADDKVFSFFVTKPNAVENYTIELNGLKARTKELQESTLYY